MPNRNTMEKEVNKILAEVDRWKEHPIYIDYVKIRDLMAKGSQIEQLINGKLVYAKRRISELKRMESDERQMQSQYDEEEQPEEQYDDSEEEELAEEPEPQMPRRKPEPQQQRQEVQKKPDKKQQLMEELGMDESDIEGLPQFDAP